jgi:hypothetical protein
MSDSPKDEKPTPSPKITAPDSAIRNERRHDVAITDSRTIHGKADPKQNDRPEKK